MRKTLAMKLATNVLASGLPAVAAGATFTLDSNGNWSDGFVGYGVCRQGNFVAPDATGIVYGGRNSPEHTTSTPELARCIFVQ
jgi:hypothetical protein